jgi:hypothetical protein
VEARMRDVRKESSSAVVDANVTFFDLVQGLKQVKKYLKMNLKYVLLWKFNRFR